MRNRMMGMAVRGIGLLGAILLLGGSIISTGCTSSAVIERPDLSKLRYDQKGALRYDGDRVSYLKLEEPWYLEMLPHTPLQWTFTVGFGAVSSLATGVLTQDNSGGSHDGTSEETTSPSTTLAPSGSKDKDSSPSPTSDPTPTPDPGSGDETPF